MSFFLSFILVCFWVLTGHWLLMDGTYGYIYIYICVCVNYTKVHYSIPL